MVWSMFMLCLVHFSALSPELSNSISYPDAFAIYDQPLVSVQRSAERDWPHCWRHYPELCCCYVQTVFVILNTCKENCWKAARGGPNRAEQWPPSRSTARSFRLVTYRVCLLYVCVHVGHHVVGYVCVYIYQEGHFLPRFCCAMWILLTKLYDDCFNSNKRRHGQSPVISSDVTLWVVVLQYLTAAPNVIC